MMSHSCILIGCMFVLLTAPEGMKANKGNHFIDAFPEYFRRIQQYDSMNDEPLTLPVQVPIDFTSLYINNPVLRHSLMLKYPDISFDLGDLDIEKYNQQKRFMSLMNSIGHSNADSIRDLLNTNMIKTVKRDPENFPINMYPVQGGKQQLEVDLDNEFDEGENGINKGEDIELSGVDNDMNRKEGDMNDKNNDKLDSYPDEDSPSRYGHIGVPADVILSDADLSETDERSEYIDDNDGNKGFSNKLSGLRKRFWGARSLYGRRIPKTKSGRSHRTRAALPLVDPMLFYIGLGK